MSSRRRAPPALRCAERPSALRAKPVEIVLRLLDVRAERRRGADASTTAPPSCAPRRRAGITDGDVLRRARDDRRRSRRGPTQFASIMSMLENNLGLLIDEQDFEVAADAAEALTAAEREPDLGRPQRRRMRATCSGCSPTPESMRRDHRGDARAPARLRRARGVPAAARPSSASTRSPPLLEVLAEEKDMAARKAIVDLISGMAERYIPSSASA